MKYFAHIKEVPDSGQTVRAHLEGTAERAAVFAQSFSAEEQGYLCGLLHDVGKYSAQFQQRIRGAAIFVDHSTAGAQLAVRCFSNPAVAFCIAGHHGGLPDVGGKYDTADDGTMQGRLKRKVEDYDAFAQELTLPVASARHRLEGRNETSYFYIKMLFSCLVDADFLDTERFMSGEVDRAMGELTAEHLEKLMQKIESWRSANNPLNRQRTDILQALIAGADGERGVYSLTVPTGGGKTVGSMAFALHHAKHRGQRRIIYIIPYTSIIEQTKEVFDGIFGSENVLAHYANVEYRRNENGDIEDKAYLAAENWDAPIVLTTAVQFFESIFANKSSRSRKLHNIADSVLIFDEAQMLPVSYLLPCVYAISQLVKHYGCTAVLCTATQPSLGKLFAKTLPGQSIEELCPKNLSTDAIFRRVTFSMEGKLSNEALTERLNAEPQVLCVVNSRKQAQMLYRLLKGEGCYHLSTMMIAAHRRQTLEEIRQRLRENQPCRVISTSLIEAGVDVDFPTVYRSISGLDSILQAAGRCNREGKRQASESIVHIFEEEGKAPEGLQQNISAAKRAMRNAKDIAAAETITSYFDFLFDVLKGEENLDTKKVYEDITSGRLMFQSIAKRFHLIETADYTIYIPIGKGEELVERLEREGPSRSLLRSLGQYSVGVYPKLFGNLEAMGAVKRVGENAGILKDMSLYKKDVGLQLSDEEASGQLICV